MNNDNMREVRFDKHCPTCKHWTTRDSMLINPDIGDYSSSTGWTGKGTLEEYIPCCYCLEEGMREGSEVPVEWEEKE